jgi:AAA15 family ATPase/GTPase
MEKLVLVISLLIATSITAIGQYKYEEVSTERFIYSIREYRAINGVEDSVAKQIKTAVLDSTWTIFIQDSVQVSDEIEIPVLYGVDTKDMNRVVSEAYANEMFNKLIENNSKFKEFCTQTQLPKSLVICNTRYTPNDSYYVFTILTK